MGSIVDDGGHVDKTVFVAVGKNVKESEKTLLWAAHCFAGKTICVLHVHQPAREPALDGSFSANKLKRRAVKALWELHTQRMHDLLNQYLLLLAQEGVKAEKVWIEMDSIEEGIVELIVQRDIKWLVMGAAANKFYSKRLDELKSKKAIFVCQHAPSSCHIWFACEGRLIYTRGAYDNREGRIERSEIEIVPPLLLLHSDIRTEGSEHLGSESRIRTLKSIDGDELEDRLGSFSSQCSLDSSWAIINRAVGTSKSISSSPTIEEEESRAEATSEIYHSLDHDVNAARRSKWKVSEETQKRWNGEDDAMEARCKAKALEAMCSEVMYQTREMIEELAREKPEVERVKNQHDELMKELSEVQDQNLVLQSKIAESQCTVKELEEKIFSAVELLISFKEQRDRLRLEVEDATRKVKDLKKLANGEDGGFCGAQALSFSFTEINEATHEFDPLWKIGEGRSGSVYKGFLRHMHVAIKMLPAYGSQSHLEFEREVETLSRVRHPHLATIIGSCPESRSLVYEYLKNGSLEDRLTGKDKTPPLPWMIRTRIAIEMCNSLVFLHSNDPPIVHGNLKPSKILLDGNFVCKLSELGISRLIQKGENLANTSTLWNNADLKHSSACIDPKYLETGKLTPESDVYSFGIILLRLLTGRPVQGVLKDVKCAVENDNLDAVLDISAGNWPLDQAKKIALLALKCCAQNHLSRPNLVSEVWSALEPMMTLCLNSESCPASTELPKAPSHFVCPIFQEVMKDPYIATDGFTYEEDAIRGWLDSGHNTSPMTNLKLSDLSLVPNHALHYAIQEWRQRF